MILRTASTTGACFVASSKASTSRSVEAKEMMASTRRARNVRKSRRNSSERSPVSPMRVEPTASWAAADPTSRGRCSGPLAW